MMTLSDDSPKYYLDGSMIGTSPGTFSLSLFQEEHNLKAVSVDAEAELVAHKSVFLLQLWNSYVNVLTEFKFAKEGANFIPYFLYN
jgi:hypothetical protein